MKKFPLNHCFSFELDKEAEIIDANKVTNIDTATNAKIIPLYLIARLYLRESI